MGKKVKADRSVKANAQTGIASLLTYSVGQSCHRQIQGSGEGVGLLMGERQGHIQKEHVGAGKLPPGACSLPHLKELLL